MKDFYRSEATELEIKTFFGERRYKKVSYPLRVGKYYVIEHRGIKLFFDLNGEIKFIHGSGSRWPHPNEFVKRTKTNDFIFYSSGEYYGGIFSVIGEYYIPCFLYPSNSIWNIDVRGIVELSKSYWKDIVCRLKDMSLMNISSHIRSVIENIISRDENFLLRRAATLKKILNTNITVLPPDTRHVDYEVIPLIISKGCLYHCKFCRVKTDDDFYEVPKKDIISQIKELKEFYGEDIKNYSSFYLGTNDALNSKLDTIKFAIETAYDIFNIDKSYVKDKYIFLFGSVGSFLNADIDIFDYLNSIPDTKTVINIGLESEDDTVLKKIGKPISSKQVIESFQKMVYINKNYLNIELTSNFLFDLGFSDTHFNSMLSLINENIKRTYHKGTIYLSPLRSNHKRLTIKKFMELKRNSHLPMYLYIIQRF